MKLKNIIGNKFGRLTVIKEADRRGKGGYARYFLCECECGKMKEIYMGSLTKGKSLSCGCYHKERVIETKTTHGESPQSNIGRSDEYKAWSNIKTRCYNVKDKRYPDYGGRGIKMCDRWLHSFENFLADMGRKPTTFHTIGRYPDVNGNYEPNNCRWETQEQQVRCKTNNRWVEYNGFKMIITDWARYFGVTYSSLNARIKNGQPFNEIHQLYQKKNKITIKISTFMESLY